MPEELRLIGRSASTPNPTLRDVLAVVFRWRRVGVMSFVAIFAGAVLYGWLDPTFEAHMKVLVRRGRIDPMISPAPTQAPQFDRGEVSEEELNSEVELLLSDEVLREVVIGSRLAERGAWLSKALGENDRQRVARAARRLSKKLKVEAVKKSTVISVTYRSSDPELSAQVLRRLASAYLDRHSQVRRPSGESMFFDQQASQARQALEGAEIRLLNFSQDQGVVSAALERDISLQKLGEAEAANRQTRVAVAETAQRLRTLERRLPTMPERTTTQVRNLDNPELMEKMKSKLLELQLKRTELLTKFEPSYRLVKEVDQQIAEVQASIASEDRTPLRDQTTEPDSNHEWAKAEALKAQVDLNGLLARQQKATAMVADYRETAQHLGERAIRQENLLRDLRSAEGQYLLYTNKREEAHMADALDQGKILNVTLAEQPSTPDLPLLSTLSFGFVGLLAGGCLSTGLVFTLDYLDPSFRTPDEVVSCLGGTVLASLPKHLG